MKQHMKRPVVTVFRLAGLVAVIYLASMSKVACAKPSFGANCANCHTNSQDGLMQVTDQDTVLDLGTQLDGNTRGPLKTFEASPGDTVSLAMDVLNGAPGYAVELKRLESGGQQNDLANKLVWTAANDASNRWVRRGDPPYFTKDNNNGAIAWTGSPVTYTFDLLIDPNTPLDVYDLDFAIATEEFAYDDEHFYLSVVPGPVPLQAGDADMDYDFDQLDLVRVQIAAKYLTGQAATWGDGDWNGAPGGSVGNPPAGDGQFNQLDIIAALTAGKYLQGWYAALAGPGTKGDGQTSLVYDARTGELSVDPPVGKELTSINIDSARSKFIGSKPPILNGSFDNFAPNNIFKATFGSSFSAVSFGSVLPAGLSADAVIADLAAVGSLEGGGALANVDVVYVPEPATAILLVIALGGLVILRR